MGIYGKYSLDRLKEPRLELRFKCPYCKSAEVAMRTPAELSQWEGAVCRKCGSKIVLDSLSVTVIRE